MNKEELRRFVGTAINTLEAEKMDKQLLVDVSESERQWRKGYADGVYYSIEVLKTILAQFDA